MKHRRPAPQENGLHPCPGHHLCLRVLARPHGGGRGCGVGVERAPFLSAGDSLPMDVSSVHHNSTLLRYSVSLLGYGFYGDIIKDSERKRWMGLIRYDFSGNSGNARDRKSVV